MKIFLPILLVSMCCALPCAQANASDYSPLMKARKFADAERLASSRLVQDPNNADALTAKVDAILAAGNAARYDEAAKLGEQCVATHPQVSACHLTLGNALGAKAIANGIMSALGYAGTIRDAFKKAVELDPQNIEARMALMRYYLQAPGIVGGGTGKARTLTTQTASVNPEAARLMQARLDASDDKSSAAEAAVLAMPVSSNEAIADGQRDLLISLANDHMNAKRFADAERVLREAVKRFPDSTSAPYSLARVQQEQGRHREALAGFEQVLAKDPHSATWYRIGQSQQALGEKAKAVSAYERALVLGEQLPKGAKADAEKQLKVLK